MVLANKTIDQSVNYRTYLKSLKGFFINKFMLPYPRNLSFSIVLKKPLRAIFNLKNDRNLEKTFGYNRQNRNNTEGRFRGILSNISQLTTIGKLRCARFSQNILNTYTKLLIQQAPKKF